MGEVWGATDTNLNREVAVKLVSPSLLRDAPHWASLLKDEARAASALFNHPSIVAILDLVEVIDASDRIPGLVMEFLPGSDGQTFVKQRLIGLPDHLTRTAIALFVIFRAAKGLMHAHENQVVHRDIKPSNILVGNNGIIKLTDFGLAKFMFEATRTHTTRNGGTFLYWAPEQAEGAPCSIATDIYQLGCSLYELLDGQAPFGDKANQAAILRAKLYEPEPDPTNIGGLLDEEKLAILALYRRMVHVDPGRRPQAFEVVETLAQIIYCHRWSLNFQKKAMPEKTVRDVLRIVSYQIDAKINKSTRLAMPPLEYQDPEEALTEATALLMNDADPFIYLKRS